MDEHQQQPEGDEATREAESTTEAAEAATAPEPGAPAAEAGAVEVAPVAEADVEAADVEAADVEAADVEAADVEAADVEAADAEAADVEAAEPEAPAPPDPRKWYAVHTYSGHENKARLSLQERIRTSGIEDQFGEIMIPTESVVEIRGGKKRTTTRKFYPGYMFVQMELNDLTFHLVKNTPKITGFLGGTKPTPVKDHEITGINKQMSEGAIKPKPRIIFEEGDSIRVTAGPFSNFNGTILEVRPEKQKVRVQVSIFGRGTPVELDFAQVEKA